MEEMPILETPLMEFWGTISWGKKQEEEGKSLGLGFGFRVLNPKSRSINLIQSIGWTKPYLANVIGFRDICNLATINYKNYIIVIWGPFSF